MRFFNPANLRKYALGSAVLALKVATGAAQDSHAHKVDTDSQIALLVIFAIAGVGLCAYCIKRACTDRIDPREIPDTYNHAINMGNITPQVRDIGDSYALMPQVYESTSVRLNR